MTGFADVTAALGSIATALGVAGVLWQIYETKKIARDSFEDSLCREYRELVRDLPTAVLMGKELTDEEFEEAFDDLHRYFDLSNEQVFLALQKRISPSTWEMWLGGIRSNLKKPAFRRAWSKLREECPDEFTELRSFVSDLEPTKAAQPKTETAT